MKIGGKSYVLFGTKLIPVFLKPRTKCHTVWILNYVENNRYTVRAVFAGLIIFPSSAFVSALKKILKSYFLVWSVSLKKRYEQNVYFNARVDTTSWLMNKMEQLENIARFHREAVLLLLLYREAGTVSTLLFPTKANKNRCTHFHIKSAQKQT